jgi:DNA-binding CsgD family transcriptional regulator
MQLQDYLDISFAPDKATFRRRMIDFAHWMDFPIVGAVLVSEDPVDGPRFKYIGNRPPDFASASDRRLALIDPVTTRLRGDTEPFAYDQDYYVEAGAGELWELAAPYGYRTGICGALRVSSHTQLLFGLDRERDLPTNGGRSERLLADLQSFATYCADGMQRFVDSDGGGTHAPALTAREREILLRVLDGKSNWAIARLMNVSENTVKFHLKNIFRKLDVSSRVVAATKAHSLGLL